MINIDVTCRFCYRKMFNPVIEDLGPNLDPVYHYYCDPCKCHQSFGQHGRDVGYSFIVGDKYRLYFWTPIHIFEIAEVKDGQPISGFLLTMKNFCPTNMTPSNMTVDRVKTLILFS